MSWKIFAKQSKQKQNSIQESGKQIQFANKTQKQEAQKQYLSEEQKHCLLEMLERPDLTYTNPGRKDDVYIGKIFGERCYVQKRYLLWNLQDAFFDDYKWLLASLFWKS